MSCKSLTTDQFLSAGVLSAAQCHPERAVSLAVTDREVGSHATQSLHHLVELVADSQQQQSLIVSRPAEQTKRVSNETLYAIPQAHTASSTVTVCCTHLVT